MIKINLLPHREHKRKARVARLGILAATSVGLGVLLVVSAYLALSASIATQEERNAFLADENGKLDKQIAEIETLKKERQQLLDRKKVVERLQVNRGEAVSVLDQLVRQVPEGIYFSEIKQVSNSLLLIGYAQSSARVSTLMRSLNDSPVFEQPNLIEIKAESKGGQRSNLFQLKVLISREQEVLTEGKGNKGAVK
ncbi:PilN domain-containing protein [Chitinimonas taiwanensis]|uniref:Type IV pilus assembly protein PilN n=1 Tax=Chitinimonas taiwanensis DSM 18899 TaxID=1121279 RepID=A0A1K2HLB5_9NEIS|nr:PilN domain-containing protein [Chitinimonas taiwanensis]SFZ77353.1 type IV pilus assembly protein PilN [Chitinimonas taiwanensis DSM 18899]